MIKTNNTKVYYAPIQLKLPVYFEKMIEIDDPVYTLNEVMMYIDLQKSPSGCDRVKLFSEEVRNSTPVK